MKKVVVKEESKVIYLSEITNKSIVGVKWSNGKKCFVVELKDNNFIGLGDVDLETRNSFVEHSKKDYIEKAINNDAEVFVFDTLKELYKWLAEDE